MKPSHIVLAIVLTIVAAPPSLRSSGIQRPAGSQNPAPPTDEQVYATFQSWLEKQTFGLERTRLVRLLAQKP
jgi:hypothetical protein